MLQSSRVTSVTLSGCLCEQLADGEWHDCREDSGRSENIFAEMSWDFWRLFVVKQLREISIELPANYHEDRENLSANGECSSRFLSRRWLRANFNEIFGAISFELLGDHEKPLDDFLSLWIASRVLITLAFQPSHRSDWKREKNFRGLHEAHLSSPRLLSS